MQTLKQYQILERLGEGGMGVVYKARDARLGRIVAIKCLSARLFADAAQRQRFFKESQAVSSLNHPNVVTVYELFTEGDSDYLVMEYVNGKTLEQIVSSKRLKTSELLNCAVQIADALATAHASGIVHRDIKPSNLMIAEDGRVKVLDFGLAKVLEQISETEDSTRADVEQTAQGTIVGSTPYMSPEQAEGRQVDPRTDIFSLGAVMYEMCTGQRAFSGDSRVRTLAAVLTKDPIPIQELAPNTPKELQRVILRCLQKDPRRRFQSMLDLKLTLEELKADSDSGQLTGAQAQSAKKRTSRASMIIAAGLAALVGAGAWLWRSDDASVRRPLVLDQLTFDGGLTTNPAIARDGKLIAYASDRAGEGSLDIWVQYRGGEPVRITRDPADEDEPSFSPDGTKIAYRSPGGIYIVSSLGGEQPRQIAHFGTHPQFSPDGTEVLFESGGVASLSHVYRVNVTETGASPVQVDTGMLNGLVPLWSPDGQHILFIGSRYTGNQVETWGWVVARNGGTPERVSDMESSAFPNDAVPERLDAWLAGDRIIGEVSVRGRLHLFQARLHRKPWRIDRIEQITFGTGMVERASVASDGTIVASNEETDLDLWSLPLDVQSGTVNGQAKRLTRDASRETFPSISVDGLKMAYRNEVAGNFQIWLMDLQSGAKRPLTPPSRGLCRAAISMDGAQVAFHDWGSGKPSLQWMSTSGSASDHIGVSPPLAVWDWAPDGNALLVMGHSGPLFTAERVNLPTHKIVPFLKRPHSVFQTHISHDGRWAIAQESSTGILITRYDPNKPEKTDWRSIGLPDADLIRWSADDNTIYFVAHADSFHCVWGQRLDPVSKELRGAPFAVAHFHQARRSLQVEDSGEIGLAVARDKIVVAEAERTGNVWITKLQ